MKKMMSIWNAIVNAAGRARTVAMHHPKALFLAGVIIGSYFGYTISVLVIEASYRLSNGSVQLIGEVNPKLADKLKLDKNLGAYRFNAQSVTPEMSSESAPAKVAALLASQKKQTGGGGEDSKNLYSVDLPIDPSKGTKVYDVNSKTSFKLIPEFEMGAGRTEKGRMVYPINEGGQAVYTVKTNGIKEDIVLQKSRGDQLSFSYKLELPKTLEARLDDRGNLGIYSVDPAVSNAIAGALQAGASSSDTQRLKDVQENGEKDFLTYLIPAPTIVQSGDQSNSHSAKAMYKLNGNRLTVSTTGLEQLMYPISIDPSVVVTSTSNFTAGNDEGMIQFDTDAISRAALTGGTIGSWATTTPITNGTYGPTAVAYNGYLYNMTDDIANTVEFAPINANGTLGAWTATTSFAGSSSLYGEAIAYNGYMYRLSGSVSSAVQFAPINANGTLGAWTATTNYSNVRGSFGVAAYNGYVYIIGGRSGSTYYNDVQFAPINANGTLGAWTATTSFTNGREDVGAVAYNGYVYVAAGYSADLTYYNDVQFAPINADGTLGAWTATTSFTNARYAPGVVAYGGYMYIYGGSNYNDVQFAPINANGTLGAWTATTSFTNGRNDFGYAVYNGYLYIIGGYAGGNLADVQVAKIDTMPDPTLTMSSWSSTTTLGAGSGNATAKVTTRQLHTAEAYNGYLYLIGGQSGTTPTTTVHYAPINANGTLGSYALGTPLPAARHGHKSVMVNDFIYVFGGTVSGAVSNTILYSQIGANGLNGGWTSVTPASIPTSQYGLASHGNYIYVTGGGTTAVNTVYYASVASNGVLGAWTASTALPVAITGHLSVAYNNFLYVVGGSTSSGSNTTTYYAPINANGTIGAWSTTLDLSGGGTDDLLHAYDGYMILNSAAVRPVGSFSDWNGQIRYAKINANGTLGTTSFGTQYSPDRSGKGSAVYNGYIYTIGGNGAAIIQGDTQYAQLTISRPGMESYGTTKTWQTTTTMNLGVYGHTAVVYNNFIYVTGGYGGGVYRSEVRYAPINANGTIGSWTTSPNTMSALRFNSGVAVYNGYLYMTGGQQGPGVFSNTVEYAKLNADGTVGAWTTSGNGFTTARYGHVTVAHNGKLYIVGGGDSANVALGDVKYATINADGSIGAWNDTTSTTAARDGDGFVYGNKLYVLGGLNGTTYSNTVRYATINTDGTLGAWVTSSNAFATARSRLAATAANGFMYLSGGGTSGLFGDLQYAQINANGSIGPWKTSNSRGVVSGAPTAFAYHTMIAYKGTLYDLGGIDGANTPQAATYVSGLNTFALVGTYSQRIDLGQASTLDSIVMNGVLPVDQSNLMFRTAGTDGVYGPWQSPSSLVGVPLVNVRYVTYRITLDDSMSSDIFSTTGRSTVNDVTVNYTLPTTGLTTENRLKNNKYFDTSGVLQPLQTQ